MDTFSKNFSLEGKVALVTGAAYGIGFAIAEAYAKAGAKVAFNCRSQKHLDQAMADYKAKGIDAKGYIADKLKEYLVSQNVSSAIINLGGNVLLVGAKPDASDFTVGIQKPFEDKLRQNRALL